jgi:hypothetical protein
MSLRLGRAALRIGLRAIGPVVRVRSFATERVARVGASMFEHLGQCGGASH